MTLEEMGALLRQERERRELSLEKAAAEIKISKKYLVAIESGLTKDLPHPVYAKGFVKNYARLLGLDPEAMGEVLSRHYAVDEDQLQSGPGAEYRESPQPIKERKSGYVSSGASGFKPSLWLGLPLVAVFAGLVWFFFFSNMGASFSLDSLTSLFASKPEVQAPQQSAAPAPAQPTPKPEPKAEPAPASPSAPPAPQAQDAQVPRELLATGSGPARPFPLPPAQAETAVSPEALASEAQFASQGKQALEVNATQAAVLEASLEDGQKRAFTLVKGQRLVLRFDGKATLRFQQAPAVGIKFNGKDYPLEGGKADGRSITFP
ncbi:hypothetical protein NNJEOMEG_03672 [Fundidesulfovibrio magnetotacticus]|uniref:HTH cro/C1-type domain-containing protein n=1 Tax=Fundidesulfovibrio magnetotacticus TaxID=2730080 RepID=A0A6V8LVN4_9BACT|nr:helix-turn-helix domain-containing protein [Fundidesulfovibrio magnetotacticus]GFK95804.1 hypothetical protein NNJEOMEG_03672 [Fundidesulfovibrio magnetotacticus]